MSHKACAHVCTPQLCAPATRMRSPPGESMTTSARTPSEGDRAKPSMRTMPTIGSILQCQAK
eukprot:5847726-Amphidinium_carterae.1